MTKASFDVMTAHHSIICAGSWMRSAATLAQELSDDIGPLASDSESLNARVNAIIALIAVAQNDIATAHSLLCDVGRAET
jgi:hypothetical protein